MCIYMCVYIYIYVCVCVCVCARERERNEEVLLRVKEQRNILHEIVNGRLTGLVTFSVETDFYSGLLRER